MFRVGVFGDSHINSVLCDYKSLEDTIRFFNSEVDVVLHAGDILDGRGVYYDQDYYLETLNTDEMIEKAGNIMSELKKLTYWIGGNHDESLVKYFGVDISKKLKIPNWKFLGYLMGDKVINNVRFRILHPSRASPLKMPHSPKEALNKVNLKKENIDWLVFGHKHITYYDIIHGVKVLGTPSYLRYSEDIGAWVIEFKNNNREYELLRKSY